MSRPAVIDEVFNRLAFGQDIALAQFPDAIEPQIRLDAVERVHGIYAMRCPLYRTLHNAIQLSSSYTLVSLPS